MKNTQLKTRPVDDPYEIWVGDIPLGYGDTLNIEWRILKKWQADDDKPYARWFTAARSEATYGQWEYGDVYVSEIKQFGKKIK
jgi:hypothetical protein